MKSSFIHTRDFIHESVDLGYDSLDDASTDSARIYVTPNGEHYPSITTVLSNRGMEFLDGWRKAVGQEEADRVCRHAATRGTALHDLLEDYLNNITIDISKVMPHVQLMFKAARSVLDPHIGKVFLQEKTLYSDILRIAGRVDLIAEFDNEISVIDFKTSKRIKKAEDISNYFVQTCFYGAAFYERTGIPIKRSVIVMTVDGSSKPLIFKQNIYDWLPMLIEARKEWEKTNKVVV